MYYSGRCEACGHEAGFSFHSGLELIVDTETLATVPVPTRGEARMLAKHGTSFRDASRQGRFVGVSRLLCTGCGHAYEVRSLAPSPLAGCASGFVATFAAGIGVGRRWGVLLGVLAALAATFVAWVAVAALRAAWLRWRFAAREAAVATGRRCPKCGGAGIRPRNETSVPCSACGAPMRFTCTRIT